jgi:hypothetical protein
VLKYLSDHKNELPLNVQQEPRAASATYEEVKRQIQVAGKGDVADVSLACIVSLWGNAAISKAEHWRWVGLSGYSPTDALSHLRTRITTVWASWVNSLRFATRKLGT